MDIDFKKLAPWNWFKNEQQEQQTASSLPVQRNDLPAASGPVSPILQLHREIVVWARPDEFPPRNMQTSKGLRALGYNVRIGV